MITPLNPNPPDVKQAMREQAIATNALMEGRSNAYGEVTLTVSDDETTVYDTNVAADSHISLSPTTANAARCGWYISDRVPGSSFTVTHDSDALTDKTFTYGITG